jgi:hypothetical protein
MNQENPTYDVCVCICLHIIANEGTMGIEIARKNIYIWWVKIKTFPKIKRSCDQTETLTLYKM